MNSIGSLLAAVLFLGCVLSVATPLTSAAEAMGPTLKAGEMFLYVGTYTGARSKGIYLYRFNPDSGALASAGLAGEAENPSFLALHPNRRFLYSVSEIGQRGGQPEGAVAAFRIDPRTGALTRLDEQSTGGAGPCHLTLDRAGAHVLVANYGGGSVAVCPIQADGRLGSRASFIQHHGSSVNPQRQEGPHAHGIYLDAANRFALVPDLGLDKIMIYRFSPSNGELDPHDPTSIALAPGAGPRHLAFHPGGKLVYVLNELQSTVTAFAYDAGRGGLKELQTVSTLPEAFNGPNTTAEVQVHPNGKYLYGSNRGHDSIAVFAIDPATGRITPIQQVPTQGKSPRHFALDPTGAWLVAANQDSDTLAVFRVDPASGRLAAVGSPVEAPRPVCVQFLLRD